MSGALCLSFFEPQTEPPPMYRSGRLQEEQRLVTKTCLFFWRTIFAKCPNFGGLESSRKSKCPPRKFLRSNNWDLNTWGWSCRKWRQREPYTVCRSGRSGSGGGCAGKKSHAGGSRVTLVGLRSVVGFYLLLESSKSSREGSRGSSRRTARM